MSVPTIKHLMMRSRSQTRGKNAGELLTAVSSPALQRQRACGMHSEGNGFYTIAADKGEIDQRFIEVAARTPPMVNQCVFRPLKHSKASAGSNWMLPIGVAVPVQVGGHQVWLQADIGVTSPLPLDRSVRDEPGPISRTSQLLRGARLTGGF